jgi:sarcosine oxidase
VVLLDAYGPANNRASSGGESRIIRMGYGAEEIYTRWSMRALELWQQVTPALLHRIGVLWTAPEEDPYLVNTRKTLQTCGVRFEVLSVSDLEKRYPQISFEPKTWGIFEPGSGALMARRAVQAVVEHAVRNGVTYLSEAAVRPNGKTSVSTRSGETVSAGTFVFACGPWLPALFPEVLGDRIHPTRQEVFFFGTPPGDRRYAPPAMPVWIDFGHEAYCIPDLENRGLKIAFDRHGPEFDPDTGNRTVTVEGLTTMREFLGRRFAALKHAPVLETRVCQYENTSNGDFLIDRHPDVENVWLVGGGSGHGFKHGPALGEYVTERITKGGPVERRFSLATKERLQKRSVF